MYISYFNKQHGRPRTIFPLHRANPLENDPRANVITSVLIWFELLPNNVAGNYPFDRGTGSCIFMTQSTFVYLLKHFIKNKLIVPWFTLYRSILVLTSINKLHFYSNRSLDNTQNSYLLPFRLKEFVDQLANFRCTYIPDEHFANLEPRHSVPTTYLNCLKFV